GANIPHRDHPEVYAQYCRLVLLLFKPWSHASDLHANGQSWIDAFEWFQVKCPSSIVKMMNNMQILHECHNSRDD
ncbi:uncharacterized protein EV420DRAFT_1216961, partial [Desarmillaria tabescens]